MTEKFYVPRYQPEQLLELADLICTDHPGVTGLGAWGRIPAVVDGMRISSEYVSEGFNRFIEPGDLKAWVIRAYETQNQILRDSTYWSLEFKNDYHKTIAAEEESALEVLLCPLEEVPLHVSTANTVAQHIVNWRLEHGV